jgi:hypothetical protein
MSALDFATGPLFECAEDDASDITFVNATHSIGSWDTVEEYLAYRFFSLSAGFGFGEIEGREMPVSKITLPLPEFLIARLPKETNDHF